MTGLLIGRRTGSWLDLLRPQALQAGVVRLGLVRNKGSCGSDTVWLGAVERVVEMRFVRRMRSGGSDAAGRSVRLCVKGNPNWVFGVSRNVFNSSPQRSGGRKGARRR
jgi:hypothetical protein